MDEEAGMNTLLGRPRFCAAKNDCEWPKCEGAPEVPYGCGCTGPLRPNDSETHDPVNHPKHYTQGGIECIDAMEAALTPEEFRGYLKGQIMKYNWRLGHKDEPVQEAGKLLWYADRLKKFLGKGK